MAGTEALLASQINGGGCLPPPTPSAPAGQLFKSFAKHLVGPGQELTIFQKYSGELPPSLAFRASTQKAMVEGMGGFIDKDNLTVGNPRDMGFIMKNGRLMRMDRERRDGDPSFWMTSSERAFQYHKQAQVLNL